MLTARAVMADARDCALARQFLHPGCELSQRHAHTALDVADGNLPRLAHIEHYRRGALLIRAPAGKLWWRQLRNQKVNRDGAGALRRGSITVSNRSSTV